MASLRLLCTVGGDQAKLNGVQKSQLALGGVEAGRQQSCTLINTTNVISVSDSDGKGKLKAHSLILKYH